MTDLFGVSSDDFNSAAIQDSVAQGATYLTFMLGEEEYGISILRVLEIVSELPITPVPGSQAQIRGVANLRGRVIPVLCLRARFGLDTTDRGIVIVVESEHGLMGLSVDRVQDVAAISDQAVEPPPARGLSIDTSFVSAIAKEGERIRIILDVDRVVTLGGHDHDE